MANPVDAVLSRALAEDYAWANHHLPLMGLSDAAYAALMTETKPRVVPIPVGMPAPDHTPARYERAAQQHVYALQDGNASRERVTVVDSKRDLATLMKGDFATDGEAAADTWAHVSADAKALVGALTQVAVARRLSPTAALKHAWAKVATPGPPAPPPSDQETPNAAATNGNESEALRI